MPIAKMLIEELKPHEQLLLYRRRKKLSQKTMARSIHIGTTLYQKMEYGEVPNTVKESLSLRLSDLAMNERCFLQRYRSSLRISDIAKTMGYSRYHVNQMELGVVNCKTLIEFWENR